MVGTIYGIDVSKSVLELCAGSSGKNESIMNEVGSIKKFVDRLKREEVALVVVEATGGYERLLVAELWVATILVAVVNPRQTWAFAKSMGCEAKTDELDARTIALYGEKMNPRATLPLDSETIELQAFQARRAQLIAMLVAEKNHLQSPLVSPKAQASIKRVLKQLEHEIKAIDKQMTNIVKGSPTLREKAEVITQVKGAGNNLAMQIIANLPELGTLNRNKISALVGVAPFNNDSGTFSGRRQVMGGRKEVRSVFYMATLTAIRCNDKIKSFYIRLVKSGKPKMVALIAAMRKFVILLNALMREHLAGKCAHA